MLPGIDEDLLMREGVDALTDAMADTLIAAVRTAYRRTGAHPLIEGYLAVLGEDVYACPFGVLALDRDAKLLDALHGSQSEIDRRFRYYDSGSVISAAGCDDTVLHRGMIDGFDGAKRFEYLVGINEGEDDRADLEIVYLPGYELGKRLRKAIPEALPAPVGAINLP